MKTKLTHKLWAKILAVVLLAAALIVTAGGAVGIIACAENGFYPEPPIYEGTWLYASVSNRLAQEMSGIYESEGAEAVQDYLDAYYGEGQTNAYIEILSWDGKTQIAANEKPGPLAERTSITLPYEYGYENYYGAYMVSTSRSFYVRVTVAEELTAMDEYVRNAGIYNWLTAWRYVFIAVAVVGFLVALACLIFLFCAAGHRGETNAIFLNPVDKVPLDLLAAIYLCAELLVIALGDQFNDFIMAVAGIAVGAALIIWLLLSFATRCKAGGVWKNTVIWRLCKLLARWCRALGRSLRKLYGALPMIWKAVFVIIAVFFAELILLAGVMNSYGDGFWFLLLVLFNIALFLAACFGVWQMTMLKKAGKALASGDFEYKLDTSKMYWEFRSHGENLNAIGNGMAIAVEQRMKSERLKTELITNVSHDIKTPLTSIVSYVDLLQRPDLTGEEQAEYLEVLARQSARLKKLTEDLVEASKASTGNMQVTLVPTSVEEIVNQAVAEYTERLKAGRLELLIHLEEDLTVLADGRLLWRVLDNLLNNVCKYALAGTRVYLDAKKSGDRVVISAKNISRDPLNVSADELMERFVRGDASRTTEGSGLGLNIARSLTELQRGSFAITIDGDLFKAELTLNQG